MQSVRKGGLTFAPEAGTQRLRDVINKGVCEEDLLRAVGDAFESGWQGVKLYFMIGLPTETDEDILGIAELARKVSRLFYQMPKDKRGKGLRCTVSASTFVPKPFTPFQWEPQISTEEVLRRQALLRSALKGIRGVEFNCHFRKPAVWRHVLHAETAALQRSSSEHISAVQGLIHGTKGSKRKRGKRPLPKTGSPWNSSETGASESMNRLRGSIWIRSSAWTTSGVNICVHGKAL